MRYFDTFTGIGGFSLPLSEFGCECVGFSEIDKYAIDIYQKQFPNHKNYGDITKIKEAELPDFEILCGGFPCQSFSIAGQRKGFEDTRGTLFFEIARIIREKQPRLLLLENVKGLLSHDQGQTFYTIITTLDELGYDCQWQVLNSKNHGVPQNRERILIVGNLRGSSRPEVFPFGQDAEVPDQTDEPEEAQPQTQLSSTIRASYYKQKADDTYVVVGTLRTHKDGNGFRESKSGLVPTIPARAREDGSGQAVIYQRKRGFNKGGKHEDAPTLSGAAYHQNNFILKEGESIRRLTPTECERLQGFPDGWTKEGETSLISDTQRYKTLGNAVTTNVIRNIFKKIL